jgi:SOS-response transcriptional repressor LexA
VEFTDELDDKNVTPAGMRQRTLRCGRPAFGCVVVVDRALKLRSGQVVIAIVDGEFICKKLFMCAGRPLLSAANPTHPDITSKDDQELTIWGVVVA